VPITSKILAAFAVCVVFRKSKSADIFDSTILLTPAKFHKLSVDIAEEETTASTSMGL